MEGVIWGWGAGYVDDDVVVERVVDACVNLCLLSVWVWRVFIGGVGERFWFVVVSTFGGRIFFGGNA